MVQYLDTPGVDAIPVGVSNGESGDTAQRRWVSLVSRPGWLAVIGLALALILGVFLGLFIPSAVERNLLNSRVEMFTQIADDLVDDGLIDVATASSTELADFDLHVRHRLIGVDVFRVVLWDQSGVVVYSDAPELVGLSPSSDQITRALRGEPVVGAPDATEGEFESVPGVELLREYYLPITDRNGIVLGVFEVYEDATSISSTISSTRRLVWLSVLLGLGVLLVFLFVLSRASLGVLERRRRRAERSLAEIAIVQKNERERIIGALHDEIGQPLYRVLYGIEGSRSQMDSAGPVVEELDRISRLVRWIDETLRAELLMLHQGSITETDLDTLLHRFVDDVRASSQIEISLTVNGHERLGEGSRAALFRATREAVANARKHAGASKVDIIVAEGNRRVIVDVEDDGSGFRGNLGLGLSSSRDRLEAVGGGLKLLASADGGTLFRAWVPLPFEGEPLVDEPDSSLAS